MLSVWSGGQQLAALAKRPGSGSHVEHPDQFRTVTPAASRRAQAVPIGHLRAAPQVVKRELVEYDHLCGVEVLTCNSNCAHLGLTQLEKALPTLFETARQEQWTYETFMSQAVAAEIEGRDRRAAERRMTAARLPTIKTLEAFDFGFQPDLSERLLS